MDLSAIPTQATLTSVIDLITDLAKNPTHDIAAAVVAYVADGRVCDFSDTRDAENWVVAAAAQLPNLTVSQLLLLSDHVIRRELGDVSATRALMNHPNSSELLAVHLTVHGRGVFADTDQVEETIAEADFVAPVVYRLRRRAALAGLGRRGALMGNLSEASVRDRSLQLHALLTDSQRRTFASVGMDWERSEHDLLMFCGASRAAALAA